MVCAASSGPVSISIAIPREAFDPALKLKNLVSTVPLRLRVPVAIRVFAVKLSATSAV
ncbi:hypothetical protein D3C85_1858940 [compost metagenome]